MKRATAPKWEDVAAIVGKADLLDLDHVCALLRVPRDRWWRVPPLDSLLPALAVQQLGLTLARDYGLAWEPAVLEAAHRLGLDGQSHARQLRRWALRAGHEARTLVLSPPAETA